MEFPACLQNHPEVVRYPYAGDTAQGAVFTMACVAGQEALILTGNPDVLREFQGEAAEYGKLCPLTHENRLALNRYFSYTTPRAMGRTATTLGLGDRLGLANYAHLLCIREKNVLPILAQQSMRELQLTHRTYEDVLDAAVWAVFRAGWRYGFGADGDHLKNEKDIASALACGYSMITLDCSEVLQPVPEAPSQRRQAYLALPEELRVVLERTYGSRTVGLGFSYPQDRLEELAICYGQAITLCRRVWRLLQNAGRAVDLELSLDETAFLTAPDAHFFVASELQRYGVSLNSLAPKFVGAFQKGVDYIGDPQAFAQDLAVHCRIADFFGYKISVHSGSDKFSVFPAVGRCTGGRFHLKTAGTSWLEAVRVIAKQEPALYRRMHRRALEVLTQARAYYVVHADPARIEPLDLRPDEALPGYMDEDDARQVLHITYGFLLDTPGMKQDIYRALERHREEYQAGLVRHIGAHVAQLGIGPRSK